MRLDTALAWLKEAKPDVVALQEIQMRQTPRIFPPRRSRRYGYNCAVRTERNAATASQILSKRPVERTMPARVCFAGRRWRRLFPLSGSGSITGDKGTLRLASIYAPNGNPIGTEKFTYKLAWLERLHRHAKELLANEEPLALIGDYNIIPEDRDCYDPKAWVNDALFQPPVEGGLTAKSNIWASRTPSAPATAKPGNTASGTYQAGACRRKNQGIRIDHILLSPQGLDRLKTCGIGQAYARRR